MDSFRDVHAIIATVNLACLSGFFIVTLAATASIIEVFAISCEPIKAALAAICTQEEQTLRRIRPSKN